MVPEITYYDNDQKQSETYYLDGKRHSKDGPAVQYWYENGQKKIEEYCLDDKEYSRRKWLIKLRKEKLKEIKEL